MATPAEFYQKYGPVAIDVGQRLKIDPTIILGQWGLETGWGKSVIPGTNNLGNIKDFSGGGVSARDNMLGTDDKYRIFGTPAEFGDHYVGLVERMYPDAIGVGQDAAAFGTAMKKGGYAEDPGYVDKIASVTDTVRKQPGIMDSIATAIFPSAQAGVLPTAQPKPWREVISSDGYKALSPQEQAEAQIEYFNTVVAPRVNPAQADAVRADFFTQYAPPQVAQLAPVAQGAAPAVDGSAFGAPMPLNQENVHVRTPQEQAAQAAQAQGGSMQGGIAHGLAMGVRDPIDAGAQILRRVVPEGVGRAVDAFGNKLADMGLPVARSNGVAGVDNIVNQVNTQYEGTRKAAGRDGIDLARIGGNIAGTAPLMALTPSVAGMGIGGRIGVGVGQGAALGAANPVLGEANQADFLGSKTGQIALGGALGAATPLVMGGVGRVVAPNATRAGSSANVLTKEGIQLTPGQMAGGVARRIEDAATSIPGTGDAIRGARNRGIEQLNKAVYGRVLKPIGGKIDPKAVGRAAVDDVSRQVSNAYDDVLSKVSFGADDVFNNDIARLRAMAARGGLPEREAMALNNILDREIMEPLSKGIKVDGLTFKRIEAQLGEKAKGFLGTTDQYQRDVGAALLEAQAALRRALVRSNPKQAGRLKQVNESFAQLTRLQTAAAKTGAKDGIFTPSQLDAAVRAGDLSVRKNKYARGQATMQDLADAARSRMNDVVPNSGTTDRALATGLVGGGAYALGPALLGGIALGSLPYLPIMDKVTSRVLFSRPQGAEAVANQLQKLPPGLLGILAQ